MKRSDIIAFRTLVKHQNFSRAGEELFIPQPTLSKKIKSLEEELGVTLLKRGKGKIYLTSAGKVFYEESLSLLIHEKELLENVRNAAEDKRQSLNVAFMGIGIARRFLEVTQRFTELYPKISLEISIMNFAQILSAMQKGLTDLAVMADLGISTLPRFRCEKYFRSQNVLIAPKTDEFLKKDFDFASLATRRFIVLDDKVSPRGFETVLSICKDWGFTPNIVKKEEHIEDILYYVEARQGVSVLPDFDFTPSQRLTKIPIPNRDLASPVYVVGAYDRQNSNPALRLFREAAKEFLE